jgi:hypothetical protein
MQTALADLTAVICLESLESSRRSKPSAQLIRVLFPTSVGEEIGQPSCAFVFIQRPLYLDSALTVKHILGRPPTEPTLWAPAKHGMHVPLQPRHAPRIGRIPRAPTRLLDFLLLLTAALGHLLIGGRPRLVQDLEGGIPRHLGAHGGGADARVQAVGLLGDGDLDGGEDALQLLLVGGGLADGVDVDLLEVDPPREDALDQLDGGVHGLGVEVVRGRRPEHVGADVTRRERRHGPAAGLVQVRPGRAERLHQVGPHRRREHLAVVEVVRRLEQRVRQRERQEEHPVHHGAQHGAAPGLVDAQAAWRAQGGLPVVAALGARALVGRRRRCWGRKERRRYRREVCVGIAGEEGGAVHGGRNEDVGRRGLEGDVGVVGHLRVFHVGQASGFYDFVWYSVLRPFVTLEVRQLYVSLCCLGCKSANRGTVPSDRFFVPAREMDHAVAESLDGRMYGMLSCITACSKISVGNSTSLCILSDLKYLECHP